MAWRTAVGPLSVLLLTVSRRLLGDSLPALRLLPALAGAATVVGAAEEPGCRVMMFGRSDQIFRTHHSP